MALVANKIEAKESASAKQYRLFYRLLRLLKILRKQRGVPAETIVGSILHVWCAASFPELPSARLRKSDSLLCNRHIRAFAQMLERQPFIEAAYWLSSSYTLLCSDKHRDSLAMFFTPPPLTTRLLDDLEINGAKFDSHTFLDPACGGAAFLAPLAFRIGDALRKQRATPKRILNHVRTHLIGMDLDKSLCKLSRHFLLMALYDEIVVTGYVPNFNIRCGNSLTSADISARCVDVVVCNPPYRKLKSPELLRYKDKYPEVTASQPNLYSVFMCLCVRVLRINGMAALVTPTSYLSGQYFSELRTYLMKNVDILSLGALNDRSRVFINVQQEAALTIVRRRKESVQAQLRASISVVAKNGSYKKVGKCVLPNSGSSWPVPRSEADIYLLKKAAKSKYRINDYGYRIRVGAFVWNRDERETYSSVGEMRGTKATNVFPLIWSSDVRRDGTLKFSGRQKTNGEARFVAVEDSNSNLIVRNRSVVLQRVTSKEQPKRLVGAVVPDKVFARFDGYIGENHTVILEQLTEYPELTPKQLVRLLGTPVVDRYFRCISGATNVSAFELSQLVLPDPKDLKRHLKRGHTMSEAARRALLGV